MNITCLCKLFGISRQAYYKRIESSRKRTSEAKQIAQLVLNERKLHAQIGGKKLYHSLKKHVDAIGIKCGRDKFFGLLKEEGLLIKHKRRFVRTTQSYHRFHKYPNLVKYLTISRSEQVWVSDITYIRTPHGFMYLSLITDAYSKQVMGYEIADNMKAINTLNALKMAIANRRYPDRPLIHHSDRGLQYCHPDYIEYLKNNGISISMTDKHDPYQNAIAERINGIIKYEYLSGGFLPNEKDAQKEVDMAIWLYNNKRPHFSCALKTPSHTHQNENIKVKNWPSKFSKQPVVSN